MRIIVERDKEIQNLNAQLKSLNKGMMMMNSSTNILEDILEVGKYARDNTGIGYEKGKFSKQKEEMKFVPAGGHQLPIISGTTRGYRKRNNRIWYCHYCAKKGHISPYWYKLYGPRRSKYHMHKTQWVKKVNTISHVAYTSLKTTSQSSWNFEVGAHDT
ncbi:hypothetical protein LIER_41896 [Lithospermum erythrorhizon]|uniref:Uncharacterized protein n=1 Tax=Lithospermum erythrorhizon TaxID=34254 RepID=A0AAV3RHK3_LITER